MYQQSVCLLIIATVYSCFRYLLPISEKLSCDFISGILSNTVTTTVKMTTSR